MIKLSAINNGDDDFKNGAVSDKSIDLAKPREFDSFLPFILSSDESSAERNCEASNPEILQSHRRNST